MTSHFNDSEPVGQPPIEFKPLHAWDAGSVAFGVDAGYLDLAHLTDHQFSALEEAVLTNQIVVVREQRGLSPRDQFELARRFDPHVKTRGHGHRADIPKPGPPGQDLVSIPAVPQVKVLGNGRVRDHQGIADAQLVHPSHRGFHQAPLTDAQEAQGLTRFFRWHIDASLYEHHPAKVTTLLALTVPEPRRQTVVYDDGSGDTLDVQLGTTALVSGEKAFELLSHAERAWALETEARYAPRPYAWMRNARSLSNGLGLTSEGRELARGELPAFEADKVMTLPIVWKNPLTGKHALQVHAHCVEDLIIDGKAVGNLAECRRLLYELMRPAIAPEHVYAHTWSPGDLVIFHNRGVWHSVVGSLLPTDLRVYHQCNLASNEPPIPASNT